MTQPTKLILRWDILPENEAEYFEFMVNDFIPAVNRLGLEDLQAWYTIYGECEQILFSGITPDNDQMSLILGSENWGDLQSRLHSLVDNFGKKVIANAHGGFQL